MRSRRVPMTEAEFLLLPREFGWKYEYVHGCAEIRPRHLAVRLTVPVTPREVSETGCQIRPVTPQDHRALVGTFCDGFGDTVEYCDRSRAQIRRAGEDAIATFFSGKRGEFHPASRLATPLGHPRLVAGAALVVQKSEGPFLDMLFVRAPWRQHGLGTALAATAMNALLIAGASQLGSAYNVANLPSVAWHHKFGFREVPDAYIAHLRAQAARQELGQRAQIGDLTDAEQAAREAEIGELERLAEDFRSLTGRFAKAAVPLKSSAA